MPTGKKLYKLNPFSWAGVWAGAVQVQVGGAWAGAVQEQCLRAWARDKVMARLMGRGSPLDPSNGMLQIAAYLQHICCTWQFLKNYECSKDETPDLVSLESNRTTYQIS